MTCGRGHTERKTFGFCPRYGHILRDRPVEIVVRQWSDNEWVARCNSCLCVIHRSAERGAVVEAAYIHKKIDHPRDLVAFSINQ